MADALTNADPVAAYLDVEAIVAAGEAAMFSAQRAGPQAANLMGFNNPSAHQNGQFVLNVLRWLTEKR